MIDWGNLVVWPFLLGGAAICALWNWRAGVLFAMAIVGVKITQYVAADPSQLFFFSIYSVLGVLAFFLWDKHAGVVLCLVGLIFASHMAGLIEHFPKVILTEIAVILGMLTCAISGPSGGILANTSNSHSNGLHNHATGRPVYHGAIAARSSKVDRP